MPSIQSIQVDTTSWQPGQTSARQMLWQRPPADTLVIEFYPQLTDLSTDLRDPDGMRQQFEQETQAERGAVVSFEIIQLQGCEAVRHICKFRYPAPGDMRLVYLGSLMLPFCDFSFVVKVQSIEHGTTGIREAALAVAHPDEPPAVRSSEPIEVESMDELFTRMHQAPIQRTSSDDVQYDTLFPDHPLSRVRIALPQLEASLRLDPEILRAAPYRKVTRISEPQGWLKRLRNRFK
jgi:hypothetical protein